ncbi:MAG TPA: type II toxin-antitoxin system VapC family toxin [Nitrospiraceae bacterium]|nr:type II toxin-antitoxin system VapC family toxin [Nitrospiraceae bacterium]
MVLLDVNVLVYAHREDARDHGAYLAWLEELINSDQAYGLADLVLSGFLRVVTHPKVFNPPSLMSDALAFVQELRQQPSCTVIAPGPRHWEIFCRLCVAADIRGNLVPDAFLAALAIESGSEWITTDRDYHRFPGLRVRHPLHKT